MLTLTNLSKNSRTCALTLEAAKRAVQTFVFFDSYFRHCLPSLTGHLLLDLQRYYYTQAPGHCQQPAPGFFGGSGGAAGCAAGGA